MVDTQMIQLLTENNNLLTHIYSSILYLIGVGAAALVIFLLYKFLKMFF